MYYTGRTGRQDVRELALGREKPPNISRLEIWRIHSEPIPKHRQHRQSRQRDAINSCLIL
jgi:hypothetical protein